MRRRLERLGGRILNAKYSEDAVDRAFAGSVYISVPSLLVLMSGQFLANQHIATIGLLGLVGSFLVAFVTLLMMIIYLFTTALE